MYANMKGPPVISHTVSSPDQLPSWEQIRTAGPFIV